MKKFLATAIALAAMTTAFTGCSGNNDSTNSSSSAASSGNTSEANNSGTSGASGTSENSAAEARTAADLGMAASTCIEWGDLAQIEDEEMIGSLLDIDTALLEDYYVATAMMSVHLSEIIVVKPIAGSEDEVQAGLDEHFAYIKDGAAFYPAQEKSAAGAVQGKTEDGYYYIIVHEIGSEIADVMNAYQPGDEVPKLELPEEEPIGDNGVVVVPTDEQGAINYGTAESANGSTGEAASAAQ
ncbi:MAG: DUF4358 domain-containing protein [Oscillospiraceae bacterium]